MSVLPGKSSFTPGSRTNQSAGALFNDWLNQSYAVLGFGPASTVTIAGDSITPLTPRVSVETQGAAANDDLSSISAGTTFSPGAIICLSQANQAHVITVRNAVGNIILKTTTFVLQNAWAKLWLMWDGSNWGEHARDYGQDYAQFRAHHRLDGQAPVAGQPATYTHASGAQAAAGTAENAVMTPAAVAVALDTAARMIDNKTVATGLTINDTFLLSRSGVLYKIGIDKLLAPSFISYTETGEVGLATANGVSAAHALGVKPKLVKGFLRCKTAELGHNAGEEVDVAILISDGTGRTVNFGADATNYWVRVSNVAGAPKLPGRGNGTIAAITPANWRFFMRMWA